MSTRKELIAATRWRYGAGTPAETRTIHAEFVGLTGYHRKHAIRILNQTHKPTERKPPTFRARMDKTFVFTTLHFSHKSSHFLGMAVEVTFL